MIPVGGKCESCGRPATRRTVWKRKVRRACNACRERVRVGRDFFQPGKPWQYTMDRAKITAKMKKLRRKGETITAISAKLGVSKHTTYKYLDA